MINTQQFWSYEAGLTGTIFLVCFVIYVGLAIVSLVFLIKAIREKFVNRDRNIVLGAMVAALLLTFLWPGGLLPGTTPSDKFERMVLHDTDLDLHGYSYRMIKDSLDADAYSGDYYLEMVVEYDSVDFNSIVSQIRKTAYFDKLERYDQDLRMHWDSLNIGTRKGIWEERNDMILFIGQPSKDQNAIPDGFFMMLDKVKRQAILTIVQT